MSGEHPTARPAAAVAAVAARGLTRHFGSYVALRAVDLVVPDGVTLALFGPNGAGKTTLLRLLALILRPSAGAVSIYGHDHRSQDLALATLGFVSHETALYLDLTPYENLLFTARLHGLARPHEVVKAELERVGLTERAATPVRALSRGLQQRAALARALVHGPRLLLLDEPWTGLDPEAARILRARIDAHRQGGGAIVLTTHDLRQGWESADRIVLLARGKVVLAASRDDLALDELERAFAAAAAGRPA